MDADARPSQPSRYKFGDKDDEGFCFWPLDRVTPASEGEAPQAFEDAKDYFVFADHMDWSWAYAIHLSRRDDGRNDVVSIGTQDGSPQSLASAFSEFVELYLLGSKYIWIH